MRCDSHFLFREKQPTRSRVKLDQRSSRAHPPRRPFGQIRELVVPLPIGISVPTTRSYPSTAASQKLVWIPSFWLRNSADDAEESIHELGERLKRASLKGWAQSANDKEAAKALRAEGCRRSKKKP